MNPYVKRAIVINGIAFALIMIPAKIYEYFFYRDLKKSRAKLAEPLPKIGEEYLKMHEEMMNDPKTKEANAVIDKFLADHPEFDV